MRVENRDMMNGPIENIKFENISAEDCHTFLRIASVDSLVRNIKIRNVRCGCRVNAVNMDATRYCRTPIFREEEKPHGVGNVRDIEITGMTAWAAAPNEAALFCLETNADGFFIHDFRRDYKKDAAPERPSVCIRNVCNIKCGMKAGIDLKEYSLSEKSDVLTHEGNFTDFHIRKL